jgi:hypothetical protein
MNDVKIENFRLELESLLEKYGLEIYIEQDYCAIAVQPIPQKIKIIRTKVKNSWALMNDWSWE